MNTVMLAAVAMILTGIPMLSYGSFSFSEATHEATPLPLKMSMHEKQMVNVPVCAGITTITFGTGPLVFGSKHGQVLA